MVPDWAFRICGFFCEPNQQAAGRRFESGEPLGVALWSYQNGSLDQAARDKFKPFFTQWGMDPIWDTHSLASVPNVFDFPDTDDHEFDLSLEEASARQPDGKSP